MQRLVLIVFVVFACFSCEKNITDDFRKSNDRKIVLSSNFMALDTPMVHVSTTISMVDLDTVRVIENAILELQTGNETYRMNHIEDGYYWAEGVIIEPGASYQLSCSADLLPAASTRLHIPEIPMISDFRYYVDTAYFMHIDFNFIDPVDSEDYYSYYLSGWKTEIRTVHYVNNDSVVIDTSNVFLNYHQQLEDSIVEYKGSLGYYGRSASLKEITDRHRGGKMLFFSDKEINGESYDLSVNISLLNTFNDSIPEIELTFQCLDKHLIEYLLTLQRYDPNPDYPIMQAVQLYSNIEGGFGLAYASSEFKYTIDMSEWYNDEAFLESLNNRLSGY